MKLQREINSLLKTMELLSDKKEKLYSKFMEITSVFSSFLYLGDDNYLREKEEKLTPKKRSTLTKIEDQIFYIQEAIDRIEFAIEDLEIVLELETGTFFKEEE